MTKEGVHFLSLNIPGVSAVRARGLAPSTPFPLAKCIPEIGPPRGCDFF